MIIDGIVDVIDVKADEHFKCHINELFERYSKNASYADRMNATLVFEPGTVKISDWTGWTDLLTIRSESISNISSSILNIRGDLHNEINVDASVLLLYDKMDSKRAFHGEVQYRCYAEPLIGSKHMLRSLKCDGQFVSINDLECDSNKLAITQYDVDTKSGYFNLSGFHMASEYKLQMIKQSSAIYK